MMNCCWAVETSALVSVCVCVCTYELTYTGREQKKATILIWGRLCWGKQRRAGLEKDTKGKFLGRASRKKRGREQCARWMRRRRSERRRVH